MNWRLFCTILPFSFLTTGVISSNEVWEGNATQIRRGEFESEGYYAASNSFPSETGKSLLFPLRVKLILFSLELSGIRL